LFGPSSTIACAQFNINATTNPMAYALAHKISSERYPARFDL